jgi:ATP-binding cassette subfamily B (MDR/TAP) protein 1
MRLSAGLSAGTGAALEVATVAVAEAVQKIKTTAAFTRESLLVYEYQRSLDEANSKQVRFTFFAGFAAGLAQGGMILIYGPIMLFGAYLVDEGDIDFQDLMTVFFAIVMMGMSLGQGMSFAPDMADVAKASKEVFEILDRPSAMETNDTIDGFDDFNWNGKALKALKKNGVSSVSFNDVTFAYPTRPDATVLSGFSAAIQPGKVVAFVGSSGAGKSTVVQLLQRFYDPLDGRLQLSADKTKAKKGVDLRDIPVRWFRKQLGVVGQEPVLFSGSIKDNMRIGNPDLSDAAIIEACKGSQAHAFIEKFPKKYDTEVGAKGAQLSGGQKQRIAIARALARNPKVLLLDEATSALDSQSEKLVQKTLDTVMKGRTTVVVAHRLSTVRNADEIVVMEKGSVAERGTHDELMAKKSVYYQLVQRQSHH